MATWLLTLPSKNNHVTVCFRKRRHDVNTKLMSCRKWLRPARFIRMDDFRSACACGECTNHMPFCASMATAIEMYKWPRERYTLEEGDY